MPKPFDSIKQASVHKDCTIRFEGRTYSVPYRFACAKVEVRGCSGSVQIIDPASGEVVKEYPRNTEALLHIDAGCYEPESGRGEDHLPSPLPLGKVARRLEEIAAEGVATRSIDFYAALADVRSRGSSP